jgi:hypothetical protein
MSFDLFGMMEQQQATGVPFGQGLNSAGMADRQRNNDRGGNPRSLPRRRPAERVEEQQAMQPNLPFMLPIATPADQAAIMGDMVDNTNDAFRRENDRRVAIAREMRRMAHEKELKRMDQQTEAAKIDAMLRRLAQQSGGAIDIPQ